MEDFDKELDRTISETIETEIEQQTKGEKIFNSGVATVAGIVMIIIGIVLLKKLKKENTYGQVAGWTLVGIGFSGIIINGIQFFWGI